MSDYISIKDDRFWEILFDEACVEGKQAERIKKELEKITLDEKEIIRKAMERIIYNLEARYDRYFHGEDDYCEGYNNAIGKAIKIIKEEGGIE